jgi:hypothetical protein
MGDVVTANKIADVNARYATIDFDEQLRPKTLANHILQAEYDLAGMFVELDLEVIVVPLIERQVLIGHFADRPVANRGIQKSLHVTVLQGLAIGSSVADFRKKGGRLAAATEGRNRLGRLHRSRYLITVTIPNQHWFDCWRRVCSHDGDVVTRLEGDRHGVGAVLHVDY